MSWVHTPSPLVLSPVHPYFPPHPHLCPCEPIPPQPLREAVPKCWETESLIIIQFASVHLPPRSLWGCVFVVGAPWGAASVLLGQSYFQAGTAWHQWQGEILASATAERQIQSARGQWCGDPLWHWHGMTRSHHLFGTSRGHCISWKCSETSGTVGKPLML